MKIATTHVGSMPRTQEMSQALFDREQEKEVADFDGIVAGHVDSVVARQRGCGIDIVSDGESSKISYATYVKERLTGFSGDSPRRPPADLAAFPEYMKRVAESGGTPSYKRPQCTGPVAMQGLESLQRDLDNLRAAAEKHGGTPFMNAVSPGTVALFQPNAYYPDESQYLEAVAEAMREEYETIAAAGVILQIDCPDLGLGRHFKYTDASDEQFAAGAHERIEILNHALRNVPAEKSRVHVCWGNYEGPHICDIGIDAIFAALMGLKPSGLLFESSNPRHAHEWQVFAARKDSIPQDKILIPGVIDSTTNFVEHPELVAERIERFAGIVGPDRVVAGTDCGFGTFAGFGAVHPDIVWEKLRALVQGAQLAQQRLAG